MSSQFQEFFLKLSWVKVTSALIPFSGKPCSRCLRALVDLTGMSPAGVQDVLRRLEEHGVVRREASGNRVLFSLSLEPEEIELLGSLLEYEKKKRLQARAEMFSERSSQAVGWIDETIDVWRRGKVNLSE